MQRKAQWRLDFVAAENSMGFHAAQETARILGESIDYSRQGQLAAQALTLRPATRPSTRPAVPVAAISRRASPP
jgi:nitrite reductase (cytochrome c-552)